MGCYNTYEILNTVIKANSDRICIYLSVLNSKNSSLKYFFFVLGAPHWDTRVTKVHSIASSLHSQFKPTYRNELWKINRNNLHGSETATGRHCAG